MAEDTDNGALSDTDLIAILRKEEQAAANWNTDQLQTTRTDSLNAYDRKPYGTEQDGQSKVVTSEYADTVESVMPSLMRVFTSGEDIVEFQPDSPQDEIAADEASQYVPHVIMRENDGFRVIYWFLKDSLMSRLGVMTVDEEEVEVTRTDPVERWTEEEVAAAPMLAQEEGESAELTVTPDPMPEPVVPPVDRMTGMPSTDMMAPAPAATYSGTIKTTRKKKRIVVDNIAPEDLMVTPDARDLDSASFVGYRKKVTASDLRVLGMEQADIDELSSDRMQSPEQDDRDEGTSAGRDVRNNRGDSERSFWLVRGYVKADVNGDGISERVNTLYAHAGGMAGRIIERLEWPDDEVPITIGSPILMPHTIIGRSLFDQTQDLQEIGTVLTRGMLDNLYFTIRPRPVVSKRVDINSLLDWTPGMPITVDGNPNEHLSWQSMPTVMQHALAGLEYLGSVKERRTGITSYNQGLDADSLNKTMGGIDRIMSAAQQRQELIARVYAECMKRLCRHVYRAIKRCATGKVQYRGGDDWKTCDPTKWPDDMDLAVNVALGTGNKQQEMQNLGIIGAGQKALIEAQGGVNGPLVTKKHIANTFRKMVEAGGFRATQEFVASEKELDQAEQQGQGQQQQPSPEMQKAMAEIEVKRATAQADIQLAREKAAADIQLMREKAAAELQIAREKAALDAQLKSQELQSEAALKAAELAAKPSPEIREHQFNG